MTSPHELLAPLRETNDDLRPLAAAPLIERGRRQRRLRRATIAASSAAAVFVGSGVAVAVWPDSGTVSAPPAAAGVGLVKEVGQAVLDAGSASLDITVTAPKAAEVQSVHATGSVDFKRRATALTVSTDIQEKPLSVQVLVTPTASYVSNPAQPGTWVAVPELSQVVGVGQDSAALDPARIIDLVAANTGQTAYVGNETVRGTLTSRYRGTFSLDAATSMPFDVWLDGEGLPRRVVVDAAAAGVGQASMRLEMFGFGRPVTITLPKAGSVATLEQSKQSLSALFGEEPAEAQASAAPAPAGK